MHVTSYVTGGKNSFSMQMTAWIQCVIWNMNVIFKMDKCLCYFHDYLGEERAKNKKYFKLDWIKSKLFRYSELSMRVMIYCIVDI